MDKDLVVFIFCFFRVKGHAWYIAGILSLFIYSKTVMSAYYTLSSIWEHGFLIVNRENQAVSKGTARTQIISIRGQKWHNKNSTVSVPLVFASLWSECFMDRFIYIFIIILHVMYCYSHPILELKNLWHREMQCHAQVHK